MECEYDKRKKCDSLYIERYNKLLKENEELKSIIKKGITEEMKDELDVILKTNQKQAHRIDKAIEYIEYYLTKGKTKNHKQFETSILEILDKGV